MHGKIVSYNLSFIIIISWVSLKKKKNWSEHSNRDIIVIPSQYCLPSRNFKLGCFKICSPPDVESSTGNYFHLIWYSLITLLNFLFLTSKISSMVNTNFPSSSSGGNSVEVIYIILIPSSGMIHEKNHYESFSPLVVQYRKPPFPSLWLLYGDH